MTLTIVSLPNTTTALIASFDLGILEGTMLIAADETTLDHVRQEMEGGSKAKAKKSPASGPALKNRTVYIAWRGRDTGDSNEVHPGSYGSQTGTLTFKNAKCTTFKGTGSFPMLGSACDITGTKLSDEADEVPEPWANFDEAAYEEANRNRWR
ncbi:hypothetical protein K491DRAFT_688420 [Lophiostoma macrostomum CBS 122681]|uniref:Uncharacterized protein n=1 Tax=Lophiostoma macrostomum CBS 122681 TaxID=1314788 RepID=A0A6A6TN41_9PLEO|nr:hypothetical protein K491DRAFT_688420 [Lophiostoma macrostomum CBS 122681]